MKLQITEETIKEDIIHLECPKASIKPFIRTFYKGRELRCICCKEKVEDSFWVLYMKTTDGFWNILRG